MTQHFNSPLLSPELANDLIKKAKARGADFVDIFVQKRRSFSVSLEDGDVRGASTGSLFGLGIRALKGAATAYAHSDDLSVEALMACADTVSHVATKGSDVEGISSWDERALPAIAKASRAPRNSAFDERVALLQSAYRSIDGREPDVNKIFGSYADVDEDIVIVNSEGLWVEDTRCLCRLNVSVLLDDNGETRVGSFGGGNREGLSVFSRGLAPQAIAEEALRMAKAQVGAVAAPTGEQNVVLAPGWSGVLLHEAVGHGLEADFIRKKTSLFTDRLGEKVASDLVTVIDDGTIENSRGSLNVDDEGTLTQRNVLIENGILKGYMSDRLNAGLMGIAPSGNGRRQSFRHAPLPRMTNTFLASGDSTPEEILNSVEDGIYCRAFGGGQVDISNGNFVFEVREGYRIRKGEIAEPIKGATLVGSGVETMSKVSAVGNDSKLDSGIGTCGKDGQSVPVNVGLPTLRIDGVTVGGTGT